jgi:hypothetical protein
MADVPPLDRREPDHALERVRPRASERQLQLFACACARHVWPLLEDPRSRTAVEIAEKYADGEASPEERDAASRAAFTAYATAPANFHPQELASDEVSTETSAAALAYTAIIGGAAYAVLLTTHFHTLPDRQTVPLLLLDDIFGRPDEEGIGLDPTWMAWEGGEVLRLARSIYDGNTFDHLPYLGDALEEAGCTDTRILDHCRSGQKHVRGCWLVDRLLGRA